LLLGSLSNPTCARDAKAAVTTSDNGDGRFDPGSTIVCIVQRERERERERERQRMTFSERGPQWHDY